MSSSELLFCGINGVTPALQPPDHFAVERRIVESGYFFYPVMIEPGSTWVDGKHLYADESRRYVLFPRDDVPVTPLALLAVDVKVLYGSGDVYVFDGVAIHLF